MMTRQEMIDEAVRRVLVSLNYRPFSLYDPATRDFPFAWASNIPVTLNLVDAIKSEFFGIEAEAARSAVREV